VRLAIVTTVLGVAVAAAVGPQVLELVYSEPYIAAFVPLVLLFIAAAGRTIWATCTEVLMARDQRRAALTLLALVLALEVLFLAVLAPSRGPSGAAAAAAVSTLLGASAGWVLVRDLLGARPLATLARSAGSALAVGLGLEWLEPEPLVVIPAVAVASLTYVGLLWLAGEFDVGDIASVRAALGRAR
jgi:O-antigen/teichoic acid export membrane protein